MLSSYLKSSSGNSTHTSLVALFSLLHKLNVVKLGNPQFAALMLQMQMQALMANIEKDLYVDSTFDATLAAAARCYLWTRRPYLFLRVPDRAANVSESK